MPPLLPGRHSVAPPPVGALISEAAATRPAGGVARGHGLAVLDRIREADTALCLAERPLPHAFHRWLDGRPPRTLPRLRLTTSPSGLVHAVAPALEQAGMPAGPMRSLLLADIAMLTRRFCAVAGIPEVDLRLEAIDTDACWKWHVDWVPLRLVTTYRGPGTLVADPRRPGRITQLGRHHVAVFKGETWRPAVVAPIVHRSPPLTGSGTTRLFLCLDLPV